MSVRILVGDALTRLKDLPDGSVHTCVTSPPYWGLRSYQGDPGMIGLEPTFDDHLENIVAVFREVRRVLRDDGICVVNYGDAYATGTYENVDNQGIKSDTKSGDPNKEHGSFRDARYLGQNRKVGLTSTKPKDLMMMPARVALALQADGWWLRSEVIWHKPNPMPESVTDRPTSAHEKIYLLSKSPKYFYDHVAVRAKALTDRKRGPGGKVAPDRNDSESLRCTDGSTPSTANLRNVLKVATHSFKGAHFATFPPDVVRPWIAAGTSEHGCCTECGAPWVRETDKELVGGSTVFQHRDGEGNDQGSNRSRDGHKPGGTNVFRTTGWQPSCECDADVQPCTVMDPFGGAGTVGLVADQMRRDAILIEISPEYAEMARARIADGATLLADVSLET